MQGWIVMRQLMTAKVIGWMFRHCMHQIGTQGRQDPDNPSLPVSIHYKRLEINTNPLYALLCYLNTCLKFKVKVEEYLTCVGNVCCCYISCLVYCCNTQDSMNLCAIRLAAFCICVYLLQWAWDLQDGPKLKYPGSTLAEYRQYFGILSTMKFAEQIENCITGTHMTYEWLNGIVKFVRSSNNHNIFQTFSDSQTMH